MSRKKKRKVKKSGGKKTYTRVVRVGKYIIKAETYKEPDLDLYVAGILKMMDDESNNKPDA